MLPASNRGAGMNMGFPDVCLTPAAPAPVPVPYPNIAMNAQAAPFAVSVKVSMMNALNLRSMIPMTTGDEAGSASPIKGPSRYTAGSPVVNVEGAPAIHLTCPTTGNNMNNAVGAVLVPSSTNVTYCCAASDSPAARGCLLWSSKPVEGVFGAPRSALILLVRVFAPDVTRAVFDVAMRNGLANAASLILDLRGCPGGDLHAAIDLAAEFLPRGTRLGSLVEPDGDETQIVTDRDATYLQPTVILVDRHTASAAEVFAACLVEQGRACLVGERTHGKWSFQRVSASEPSTYGTAGRFMLPSGPRIDGTGLVPSIGYDEWCASEFRTVLEERA